jgi:multidrug efflux pump subunit AcrB
MTKSKESSFQIAEFLIDRPILAMLVLGLIALIGSVCIFAMPAGWLPF